MSRRTRAAGLAARGHGWSSAGRLTRQLERFERLLRVQHPPVKGVVARSVFTRRRSMTLRLARAAVRRHGYGSWLELVDRDPALTARLCASPGVPVAWARYVDEEDE